MGAAAGGRPPTRSSAALAHRNPPPRHPERAPARRHSAAVFPAVGDRPWCVQGRRDGPRTTSSPTGATLP